MQALLPMITVFMVTDVVVSGRGCGSAGPGLASDVAVGSPGVFALEIRRSAHAFLMEKRA
jgi:hypothetical protein